MFEHFQIEIKFSKLRNFEEYKMFDKEYKFSFEMFWKKIVLNNGFQKGKLDISNRNR